MAFSTQQLWPLGRNEKEEDEREESLIRGSHTLIVAEEEEAAADSQVFKSIPGQLTTPESS